MRSWENQFRMSISVDEDSENAPSSTSQIYMDIPGLSSSTVVAVLKRTGYE